MQPLQQYVAAEQVADRRSAAAASRAASAASGQSLAARLGEHLVLRRATAHDDVALTRLAELDSAPRPGGEMLLAEIDEELAAAVPLDGGRAIADPFRPTAEVVELLRLRAQQAAARGAEAEAQRSRRFRTRRLRAAA